MPEIRLIVRFAAKPGKAAELHETLRDMAKATHTEPGDKVYDLYTTGTEGRFFYFEIWPSQAALDVHNATPHYKAFAAKVPDLLAEPIELNVLTLDK